jgi:hypothetical protein
MKHHTSNSNWKGYSLEELQYERALKTVMRDIQRQKVSSDFSNLKANFIPNTGQAIATRFVSSFKLFNFVGDACRIGIKLARIYRRFKKKAE